MNTKRDTTSAANSMSIRFRRRVRRAPLALLAPLALALTVTARGDPTFSDADWSALGSGMSGLASFDPYVYALAVNGTNLYAGGGFTTAGGVPANCIAKWDGSVWAALGSGLNGPVSALAVSGANLYVGGGFTTAGGVPATNIAKWNGSAWSALGSGINGAVEALAVSGTNLYAGGEFTTAGGMPVNAIAKWNGSAWSALGSGITLGSDVSGRVQALAVSGTNLYAGGLFTTAGGVPANYIAKWDGSAWLALGSGMGSIVPSLFLRALAVSGTDLYAGGYFTSAGGVPAGGIAKWDGNAWSALGSGTYGSTVAALAVNGTNLYAGGAFTIMGGLTINRIAKWDGSAWSALGSGLNDRVYALAADGAGHLFVGGAFSLAGTNASPYIAQANVASLPPVITSPQSETAEIGATVGFAADAAGGALSYQWFLNSTNPISWGTRSDLVLSNIQFSQSGTYSVIVTYLFGDLTGPPVMLNVIPAVDRRLVPGVALMGEAGNILGLDYRDNLGPTANWETMATMTLSNSSQFCFDLSEPLPPQRFYRAWQTGALGVMPSLDLHMVPAITLTGGIGSSVRVDYINQFGPIDAWVTLATVTLTNTSQLYFDVSAPGQPTRLYRLVQVP
jgi:hypothetical protein